MNEKRSLSHVYAAQKTRYIIRFYFNRVKELKILILNNELLYIDSSFFYKFTHIDCEYIILFILTQITSFI